MRNLFLNKEKVKRLCMMSVGVFFMGLAVTVYTKVSFGTDPFTSMVLGLSRLTGLPFGVMQLSINTAVILAAFRFGRHLIGIGTLINMTCVGFIADLCTFLYDKLFPDPDSLFVRVLLFVLIVTLHSFGGSVFFTAALGVGAYDVVSFVLTEKTRINFRWCRMGTDVFCALSGFLLGSKIGIGTVVTAFFMGPLIQWFTDHFSLRFLYGKEEAAERIAESRGLRKAKKEAPAKNKAAGGVAFE